jgi:GNAT superfamily N-acetyltransferase
LAKVKLQVIEVDTERTSQVKQFLELPSRVYEHAPLWVPPLQGEERRMLDRGRNPFFQHSQAAFFLAFEGERPVGRLAVLNHRPYNEYNQECTAFFYLFESYDEPAAAEALFAAAVDWARRQGLTRMIGPKGFSPLNGMGLLMDGFQHRPALGIPYNLPYYPALLDGAGFFAMTGIVSGYLSAHIQFPERIHEIAALVRERRGLRVLRFQKRSDLRRIVPKLKDLYNLSIQGTPGNYPVTDEEVQEIAGQMLRFADPRLIKIIMKGEEIVGFLFAYPDISAAQKRTRGRLLPIGWIDLLLEMRRTPWVNINGMGILKEHRGAGGTALLFSEMQKSIVERGFIHADLVQIGSENDPMLRELRSLGVDFYKKHCLYEKCLF